jgi:hypothetical protein
MQQLDPDLKPYVKTAREWAGFIGALGYFPVMLYGVLNIAHLAAVCTGKAPFDFMLLAIGALIPVAYLFGHVAYRYGSRIAERADLILQQESPIPMTCAVVRPNDVIEARLAALPDTRARMTGWQRHPALAPLADEVAETWESFRDTITHVRSVDVAWIAEISLPEEPDLPPLAFVIEGLPGERYKWRNFTSEVEVYIGKDTPHSVVIRTKQGILIRKP